jgi:nitrate reductase beta subunit
MTMPMGWKPNDNSSTTQPDVGHQVNFRQEQIIWQNEVMTGIIHRKVVERQMITNKRVSQNYRSIALSDLDDVIVMNQHRESQGQSARYYVGGFGTSYGTGTSRGKTVGDVTFIYQGQPAIVFQKIDDPYGVARTRVIG